MSRITKTIEIIISYIKDDETGFENALDEAVQAIKAGNVSGMDGNEREDYSFTVKTED